MAKSQRGKMDARISVTTKTRDALSDFITGAGVKYDDALRWMMEEIGLDIDASETERIEYGLKFRNKIRSYDDDRSREEQE